MRPASAALLAACMRTDQVGGRANYRTQSATVGPLVSGAVRDLGWIYWPALQAARRPVASALAGGEQVVATVVSPFDVDFKRGGLP